jgi:hypothetical protein
MNELTGGELDEAVAERIFGWRWMAFEGIPVRYAPGYPQKCRVCQFLPPEQVTSDMEPATGDEPLAYRYCSSAGVEVPPDYHSRDDILVLRWVRETWPEGSSERHLFGVALGSPLDYEPGDWSRAALTVLDARRG